MGIWSNIINLVPYYSAVEITIPVSASDETADLTFSLVKAANSTSRPIVNAYEYYSLIDTDPATYSQDSKSFAKFFINDIVIRCITM